MFPPRPTELLHLLLKSEIQEGDFAIDATAGNGHDTVFLAEAVGKTGRVLAIDIQEEAITSTSAYLAKEGLSGRVTLRHGNHVDLAEMASGDRPAAVVFNLGYLPGGDHAIITRTDNTLRALAVVAEILKPGGTIAVVCYPGHGGGEEEAQATLDFFHSLAGHRTARYGMIATQKPSPFVLLSRKNT
jgi:tRNA A58 N-methylase Trm61